MTDTSTAFTQETDTSLVRVTGNDLDLKFNTLEEIQNWKNAELRFWEARLHPNPDLASKPMAAMVDCLQQFELSTDLRDAQNRLRALIDSNYIPSASPRAQILERIRGHFGFEGVAAAFPVLTSRDGIAPLNSVQSPAAQAGHIAAIAFRALGVSVADANTLRALLNDALEVLNTCDRIQVERERLKAFTDRAEEEWRQRIEGYEAKVALEAPRHYWRKLQDEFERKARNARRVWYAALGLFPLVYGAFALTMLYSLLVLWTDMQPKTFVGDIATHGLGNLLVLGTALGLGIWFLRQLLRRANSYEHLALDAAERVTMIETFAAMRGAGLVHGDLGPVLAALHRPAATGFIQDDGPATPLEVLVRGLGKPGAS